MAARKTGKAKNEATTASLGFEAKLWAADDALRNNMDAAEYKHVVLGLIFLKYISDTFEAKHAELEAQKALIQDLDDRMGPGRGRIVVQSPVKCKNHLVAHELEC